MVNIVIPLAGKGQRFANMGYEKPKPLVEVFGKPMISRVIDNIRPVAHEHRFIFICRRDHFCPELSEALDGDIVVLNDVTEGAACTVLAASGFINGDPLIIASCDQLVNLNFDLFIDDALKADGSLLTFPSTKPSCSFCRIDDSGRVVEVAEKRVISNHANVGIYFFTDGYDFIDGAERMIINNDRYNGEFYLAPVYNYLTDKDIRIFEISSDDVFLLGTPDELEEYIYGQIRARKEKTQAVCGD